MHAHEHIISLGPGRELSFTMLSFTMHAKNPCRWGKWLRDHADGLHLMLLAGQSELVSTIPPTRLAPLLSRLLRCLTLPQV